MVKLTTGSFIGITILVDPNYYFTSPTSQMQNKHEYKDEKKFSNHLLEYGGLFTYPILQS